MIWRQPSLCLAVEDIFMRISKDYTEPIVRAILKNTKEVFEWIKAQP